jgi:hypothetical protein
MTVAASRFAHVDSLRHRFGRDGWFMATRRLDASRDQAVAKNCWRPGQPAESITAQLWGIDEPHLPGESIVRGIAALCAGEPCWDGRRSLRRWRSRDRLC